MPKKDGTPTKREWLKEVKASRKKHCRVIRINDGIWRRANTLDRPALLGLLRYVINVSDTVLSSHDGAMDSYIRYMEHFAKK
jgi:hypothetical protein